jgi:AcrR family transcriptional regulator
MRSHCQKGARIVPRRVDQRARRRQIVDGLWSVTTQHGLEAVSLRRVADEIGVSVGMLQYHFTDVEAMLLFALVSLTDNVGGRTARGIAALADGDDPKGLVRAMLIELLPLDQERVVAAHVACAFLTRAAVDAKVSAHLRDDFVLRQKFLVTQLRRGGAKHSTREANHLLALVDGLTLRTLAGHQLPETALATLDSELVRLFDGSSARILALRSSSNWDDTPG